MSALATSGSGLFVAVDTNRDSLAPRPATFDGSRVHRDVCLAESKAADFSRSRGHPVYPARLPSRAVSMSVGELAPGAETSNHRHAYETLVYVLSGRGYSLIEGERVDWQAGDAFYVAPWEWHQHVAAANEEVRYLASTNLPVLHALGQTVLREEQSFSR